MTRCRTDIVVHVRQAVQRKAGTIFFFFFTCNEAGANRQGRPRIKSKTGAQVGRRNMASVLTDQDHHLVAVGAKKPAPELRFRLS